MERLITDAGYAPAPPGAGAPGDRRAGGEVGHSGAVEPQDKFRTLHCGAPVTASGEGNTHNRGPVHPMEAGRDYVTGWAAGNWLVTTALKRL
ncbi:hypothetical protein NDU88_002020 [Pleurodeles waltl]|uniref:Uncharacterized protein n=1 Tax=Pleurodeles waltl TaxID=8319 RepID=A0AAV7TLU6_PLEWA|nr:hypothetical protein NDU88_002020 [Pleurodeles waltl]